MELPPCDVVIATRNRPAALERCLSGLAAQTHPDLRVVVVDDASDGTLVPIVERARRSGLAISLLVHERRSGPAVARNTGVAAAEHDFVIFIDDDVLPDRRLVGALLRAAMRRETGTAPIVSFGPFVQPADHDLTPWNRWEAYQMKKEADALGRGDYAPTWRQFHTGNNCVPVEAFRAVGGFDADFTRAEDDELAIRLDRYGCVFVYEPAAIAWHYNHRSLDAWLQIPRSYARFDVEIDRRNPAYGYLEAKKRELAGRALPLRLARGVFAGGRAGLGITASVGAARVLDRLRWQDAAVKALSVAYDLSYVDELARAESAAGRAEPTSRHPLSSTVQGEATSC